MRRDSGKIWERFTHTHTHTHTWWVFGEVKKRGGGGRERVEREEREEREL